MAGDKGSGKKGFAGLDSMVSEVEVPKALAPEPVRKEEKAAPPEPSRAQAQPAYTGSPTSGESSGKWWLLGVGVVALFAWAVGSSEQTPSDAIAPAEAPAAEAPAPEYAAAAEAAAPEYAPTEEAPAPDYAPAQNYEPAYTPEPAPADTSNNEEMPPVGSGLVFNRSQIRYCLSENIRIEARERQVDQYSETSVDAFNGAVNDYNTRCSNFRYRSGTLESVRSEVEANRYSLLRQGGASAASNP